MGKTRLFPKLSPKFSGANSPNNQFNNKKSSSTPPCTPSPERQAPKILVETTEKKDNQMTYVNGNGSTNNPNSNNNKSTDSDDDDYDDYLYDDNSTLISDLSGTQYTSSRRTSSNRSNSSYKNDRRNDFKVHSNPRVQTFPFKDPGSLLDTVMGSCIPKLAITNYANDGDSSKLTSINEDNSALTDHIWGIAPSEDDDDDSYSENTSSFQNSRMGATESHQHDNIEMVYQEEEAIKPPPKLPSSIRKTVNTVTKQRKVASSAPEIDKRAMMENELLKQWKYCQPCDNKVASSDSKNNTPNRSNVGKEAEKNNAKTNNTSNETRKLNKTFSSILMKGKKSKKESDDNKEISQKSSPSKQKKKSDAKKNNSNLSNKLSKLNGKSNPNAENSGSSSGTSQSKEILGKTVSRVAGVFGRKNKKKQQNVNNREKGGGNITRKGRWKVTTDTTTKKIYYYHSGTKEVSWEKPPDFIEWRAIFDKNNKQHYYYNTITKETTWDRPSDFEEWRTIQDPKNPNKVYYFNVLTKERRFEKPPSMKNEAVAQNNDAQGTTVPCEIASDQQTEISQSDTEENLIRRNVTKDGVSEEQEMMQQQDQTLIPKAHNNDLTNNVDNKEDTSEMIGTDPSYKSISSKKVLTSAVASSEFKNTKQIRISHLLSKHNPDNAKANSDFIQNLVVGKEERVMDDLEDILEEVPFDGIASAILTYIQNSEHGRTNPQTTVNESFNESNGPPLNRINSLKTVKTLASHKTNYSTVSMSSRIKSNMTETTNKVNNTTSRRKFQGKTIKGRTNTIEEPAHNLDDSLDQDDYIEDDLSQITPASMISNDTGNLNSSSVTPRDQQNVQYDDIDNVIHSLDAQQVQRKGDNLVESPIKINSRFNPVYKNQRRNIYSKDSKANDSDSDSGIVADHDDSYAADEDVKSSRRKHSKGQKGHIKSVQNPPLASRRKDIGGKLHGDEKCIKKKDTGLDDHISENNWNAVAQYIATMRKSQNLGTENSKPKVKNPLPMDEKISPKVRKDNGELFPRKRFGARSLAQYDENEQLRSHDEYEELHESFSWEDKSESSESEFTFDISVGTEDSNISRGITTEIRTQTSHKYGNHQLV